MKKLILLPFLFIYLNGFSQKNLESGKEYARLGDYAYALEYFAKALIDNPNDINVYLERAKAYDMMNKQKDAYDDLESALALQPKNEDVYFLRIKIAVKNKEFDKALTDIATIMKNNPQATELYAQLVDIKLQKGDKVGAMQDRIKEFTADEIQVFTEVNKGVQQYLGNNFDQACETWSNVRGPAKSQAEYFIKTFCPQKPTE